MPDNDFGDPYASHTVKVGHHGPVTYTKVSTTTSADIRALVANKKIRLLAMSLIGTKTNTGTWKLQSGGTTDLTPAFGTDATGELQIIVWPYNPMGWVETASGEKLNVVLTNSQVFDAIFVTEDVEP